MEKSKDTSGTKQLLTRADVENKLQIARGEGREFADLSKSFLVPSVDLSWLVGEEYPDEGNERYPVVLLLRGLDLRGADLSGNDPEYLDLSNAKLEGADVSGGDFRYTPAESLKLTGVDWGNYKLKQELVGRLTLAEQTYRIFALKHNALGLRQVAGEFYYREMECHRKQVQKRLKRPPAVLQLSWWEDLLQWAWSCFVNLVAGYGERPERVVLWAVAVLVYFAAFYLNYGVITSGFGDALYFSGVSFTALGYGSWAPEPLGWGRFLGVVESFMGVFTMALFITLFVRKMTR